VVLSPTFIAGEKTVIAIIVHELELFYSFSCNKHA